jgi:hypothetical protein
MTRPPTGPFWIWTDIDGSGSDWHLAHVTAGGDPAEYEIHYPLDDFIDFFYLDEWEPHEIRLIRKPKALE